MNKFTIGVIVAAALELITLFILALFYSKSSDPVEFIKYTYNNKSIVTLAAFATVPNVILFFYMINQNKLQFSKGVQVFIICLVVFLAIVKFT